MYITNKDSIIFDPKYNYELNIDLISQYKKIIFSDWELSKDIYNAYENNIISDWELIKDIYTYENSIFNNFKFIGNIFNQKVTQLPPTTNTFNFWKMF